MEMAEVKEVVGETAGGGGGGGGRKEQAISRVLENLEADVTCHICFDQYREPKLLPCAHYFCRRCIRRVSEHARGKPFPCPVCNETTTLPLKGVDELPGAFFVEHLLEVHRAIDANKEELRGPRKLTCDVCKKGQDVSSFCKECDQFLCTTCMEQHTSSAIYARHHVMSLDELRARRQRGSTRNLSFLGRSDSTASYAGRFPSERARREANESDVDEKSKVYAMCPRHPDERIKVYCHDHDAVICRDCTVYDHPLGKCKTGFIKDEAPEARRVLRDALVPVLGDQESLSAAERDLTAVHDKVVADADQHAEEIRNSFRQIRKRMDGCEETLLGTVAAMSQGKKEALQSQTAAVQLWKQGIEKTIEGIKTDLGELSDEDILLSHKGLLMKMEKEIHQHRMRSLEPITPADLTRIGPSPDEFPAKLGLAYPRLDLFQLKIQPPSLIHVGIKTVYPLELPHSIDGDVKVEVQSSIDPGCVIKANVELKKGREEVLRGIVVAKYEVSFIPRVRGPQHVRIKVNEQELPGSPFTVFAHISPHHLGAIIYESVEAGKPYGICLSPEGHLVTAGNGSMNIRFWSKELEEVSEPLHCQLFRYPRGVVCGTQPGVVYTTDKGTRKGYIDGYTIMKFVNGELERGYTQKSRTLRFIKLIRGQIFVADENSSEVHRFSADKLIHIASFSTSSKANNTHDMAEYNDRLYVVGSTKIATYSFDDWRYLSNVPLSIPMAQMRGICFDRAGYMYVTQTGTAGVQKGVFAFEPMTGNFVTSFGHFLEWPLGITINDDGFVYVVDHREIKRRIYAF